MRACCPCLVVHQIFIILQTTVTAQYYWQGRGKQGRKSKLPQVVTKLLQAAICRDLQKEFVASLFRKLPQLSHIPDKSGSWPENCPFVLDILERSSFFRPKLSCKFCFFSGETICSRLFLVAKWNRFLAWCPLKEMETIPANCFLL